MAVGRKQPGFPASRRQMEQLLDLVVRAGHCDWRDARGPLGLTQSQSKGRFTSDEADELIARLSEAEHQADLADRPRPGAPADAGGRAGSRSPSTTRSRVGTRPTESTAVARRRLEQARLLQKVSDDLLAAELQRRGWAVIQP